MGVCIKEGRGTFLVVPLQVRKPDGLDEYLAVRNTGPCSRK
jgi:hypothetical protein